MCDFGEARKWILQTLRLYGITARVDAADFLADQFKNISRGKWNKTLEYLTDHIRKLNFENLAIDRQQVEKCYEECLLEMSSTETVWSVINAFNFPRFLFNREKCMYQKDESILKKGLFGNASSKPFMQSRLYATIMQSILKHTAINQVYTVNGESFKYMVETVEWFLSATEKIEHAVIIGLLVQKSNQSYAVEDVTGRLDIDITQAKFSDGLFPEHSIVFLEGYYEENIFYVLRFGLPPPDMSNSLKPYFDDANTFGGPSKYTLKKSHSLRLIEERNPDEIIVFISDLWLDQQKVLEKFQVLLEGFSGQPPYAFVLMGNFLSVQQNMNYEEELKSGFAVLADIISCYKKICDKCQFVLVPGPLDIGSPRILPRTPFPRDLVKDLLSKVPNLTLATNPCRIQYCTKEIVVIREDLVSKLCRNTIHFPKNGAERISHHFVRTILSQGTLTPLSPMVCPVYWNFSHAMEIYPLPDLIVAADQFNSFKEKSAGCTVVSPGSFVKEKFSFYVYAPSKNEVQVSFIPDEP